MEARSCNFRTDSYIFRKGKTMGNRRSNLPQNFTKMEDYQRQNSPKSAEVVQKLRSIAKIARLRKNMKVAQKLCSATSQFSGGTTLAGTKLHCLVRETHWCEQLAQSCYPAMQQPWVDLTISRSRGGDVVLTLTAEWWFNDPLRDWKHIGQTNAVFIHFEHNSHC